MTCRSRGGVCAVSVWLVGLVLATGCGTQTDPVGGGDSTTVTPPAGVAGETGASNEWQAVNMDDMATDRSAPEFERRNPFRFGPRAGAGGPGGSKGLRPTPVLPPRGGALDQDAVAPPRGDTSVGGAGGVPLSFVGFLESPGIEGRVVVLTDGEVPFYGRMGDVIDGRYRIVGLGLESVDVERIDGQGQQTLRLPSESPDGL